MEHQDWTTVSIGRKRTPTQLVQQGKAEKEIVEKKDAGKNIQLTSDINLKKIENNEIGVLPRPTLELSKEIQLARTAKKLTQVQLNTACNFPKGTVAKYENGQAVINDNELRAMSKVLGVVIKKPKN